MPSNSYVDFLELLVDVEKLMKAHYSISKGLVGRKNLGYLTRSATVMLCAAWERYNENVLLECIDRILTTPLLASSLPTDVKKYLSFKIKENRNEIAPIELADNGWRNLWKGYATTETDLLHTPNSAKLNLLFKRFLGIDNYVSLWQNNTELKIDAFIRDRGEIAHRGTKAKYIRMNMLRKYFDLVVQNSIEIDYNLSLHLENEYNLPGWRGQYHYSIESHRNG